MPVIKEKSVPPFLRVKKRVVAWGRVVFVSAIATTEIDHRVRESVKLWTSYNRGKSGRSRKKLKGRQKYEEVMK